MNSSQSFYLFWSSPFLSLKKYSRLSSLFSISLHSVLPNLLSVDNILIVKTEVINYEISYLLPSLHPHPSILPVLSEHLYSSLPVVTVPLSGSRFSSLHANVCLSFKSQLRYCLFYKIFCNIPVWVRILYLTSKISILIILA